MIWIRGAFLHVAMCRCAWGVTSVWHIMRDWISFYLCICLWVCLLPCVHVSGHTCVRKCLSVCIRGVWTTCIFVYLFVCMYLFLHCVRVWICVRVCSIQFFSIFACRHDHSSIRKLFRHLLINVTGRNSTSSRCPRLYDSLLRTCNISLYSPQGPS